MGMKHTKVLITLPHSFSLPNAVLNVEIDHKNATVSLLLYPTYKIVLP